MTVAAVDELPIGVRPMTAADRPFVFETTVKVRWPRRNGIPWGDWLRMHGPTVDGWLDRGTVEVAEAGGVLLGFAVWFGGALAMLYVKRSYRGEGIGVRLLAGATSVESILPTPSWQRWCERRSIKWERAHA